jgi:hypothetical protein
LCIRAKLIAEWQRWVSRYRNRHVCLGPLCPQSPTWSRVLYATLSAKSDMLHRTS